LLSAAGQDAAGAGEVVVFSVVEDDPDAPKGRREVVRSTGRQADFVVPPGTYYVVARAGSVEARERLAVGPGDVVRRTLNLAAGRLALATKVAGVGWGAEDLVSYRVERLDSPIPEAIVTSRPAPVLWLMSGRYRVVGRLGTINARAVREVEVRAGQAQQVHGTARAVPGPPGRALCGPRRDAGEAHRTHRRVARRRISHPRDGGRLIGGVSKGARERLTGSCGPP
jgi:Ca-activated chloride channel family protein